MVCAAMQQRHGLKRKRRAICPLIMLPKELLQMVVDNLQLEDFIHLNSASKAMKSSLEPIKVNSPIIINENQSSTWHTMVKEDRALASANMYRGTLTHLVISYQSASTPLQISHFFSLVASFKSLKILEIQQTKYSAKLEHFLSILMKKFSSIKVIVPKDSYTRWVSAWDTTESDRKFNVQLCYPHQMVYPADDNDSVEDLLYYEKLDATPSSQTTVPSKRAFDLIETPPDYRKQRDEMTRMYKKMMLQTMSTHLALKSDGVKLPAPLAKFINPFDIYEQYSQPINVDSDVIYQDKEHTERLFGQIGSKFMHCILTNDTMTCWVIITELDVFLSNRQDLDDCAYKVAMQDTKEFIIKITNEKNNGRGYSELIIQCGDYQIVATGGLYGNNDAVSGGFLGSSVSPAIGSSLSHCYTLKQQQKTIKCKRDIYATTRSMVPTSELDSPRRHSRTTAFMEETHLPTLLSLRICLV